MNERGEGADRRIDELDEEILGAQNMAQGAYVPLLALSLALLDKGVLERSALLDIMERLRTLEEAACAGELGDPADRLSLADQLLASLGEADIRPGSLLRLLDRRIADLAPNSFRSQGPDKPASE